MKLEKTPSLKVRIRAVGLAACFLYGLCAHQAGSSDIAPGPDDVESAPVMAGRFALLTNEKPPRLRVMLRGTPEVKEVDIDENVSVKRGPIEGTMEKSTVDRLKMGDYLTVRLSPGGSAREIEARYRDLDAESSVPGPGSSPRYIGIHRSTTAQGEIGSYWSQSRPASIAQDGIDELLGTIGTRGTSERQLAFSYTISYMHGIPRRTVETLENLLRLSEENDLAVIVHLDGVNFWGGRPDLWNWWDPDAPGYDPKNVYNVEWYDWGPENAVRIGWRNWGRQIRVRPQANLASPAVLRAHEEQLEILIPRIIEWHDALPDDRKYLLAAVVLGWETSPYVQSYYYRDGNSYLDKDPSNDPEGGSRASLPLGYAALTSLGRKHRERISGDEIDSIVRHYLERLYDKARELGLPAGKIVTHGLIHPGTEYGGAHSGRGAIVRDAIPGWSFYGKEIEEIEPLLDELDGAPWAAIEVRFWNLSEEFIESLLTTGNGRIVNFFNWESFRFNDNTIALLREVLLRDTPCETKLHTGRNGK